VEGYINTADNVSVCIAEDGAQVDYEINDNNAYQRAEKLINAGMGSNQNVENSSGRSGMLG
jgi:hypothetical protein